MKHGLKAICYLRYADDFAILSHDCGWLESLVPRIRQYLWDELRLKLHPDKVSIRTLASGVDFLGWVHFPDHRVLRATTKKRMLKRIGAHRTPAVLNSYLGLLAHGNAYRLRRVILNED